MTKTPWDSFKPVAEAQLDQVEITDDAKQLVDQLRDSHGPLMFHQSGGCCDGSSPMCYAVGEFLIGQRDVKMGTIHGCEFYIAGDQYEVWKHSHLTVDVVEGRGASFSLEIPLGLRFVTISRVLRTEENC